MTTDTGAAGASSQKPARSAPKAELVDYAVSRGADRNTAENLTAEQLRQQYIDTDQGDQAGPNPQGTSSGQPGQGGNPV